MCKKCRIHNTRKEKIFLPGGRQVLRCPVCDKDIKRKKFNKRNLA